jgi:hypothetical protein
MLSILRTLYDEILMDVSGPFYWAQKIPQFPELTTFRGSMSKPVYVLKHNHLINLYMNVKKNAERGFKCARACYQPTCVELSLVAYSCHRARSSSPVDRNWQMLLTARTLTWLDIILKKKENFV